MGVIKCLRVTSEGAIDDPEQVLLMPERVVNNMVAGGCSRERAKGVN